MTQATQDQDTIFALASGRGAAGVAVIRLSGPRSLEKLYKLNKNNELTVRQASLCWLHDPRNNQKLDQVLALYFAAPDSFTGEDVVEIHCHGGPAVIEAITQALLDLNLRVAEPGEFTRRAFENGKMDLLQAEALNDLVTAQSQGQRQQALGQMSGELSREMDNWRDNLLAILALIEAEIDFSEEDDVPDTVRHGVYTQLETLISGLEAQLATADRGEKIRKGYMVALVGPVNAGKSTLLNALAGEERAIVSDIPGTTRDIVRVETDIAGFLVTFADTAGLRDSDDSIEQEGVRRAGALAKEADLRLFLRPVDEAPADIGNMDRPGDLFLCTKTDLMDGAYGQEIGVSAKTGAGMAGLLDKITERVVADLSRQELPALTRVRHRRAISLALEELQQVMGALDVGPELAAEHLRAANKALLELVGAVSTEDVLGAIFSQFCIGK